eukprot:m.52999 g.52999  ORF g.52999 m.52999 type:complete len:398 (-) comp9136_c0_seq1:75-1268(-)
MSGAVWVVDPGEINLELFQCWLDGVPVEKAAAVRKDADGFGADVVLQDTVDEYRTFELLEKYMQNPLQLATQTVITISSGTQQELLALYYAYDDAVMREILCNQLSKKIRNDLDVVADKTRVSLKSVHRQFDNLRRIFRKLEDRPGQLSELVLTRFVLKPKLANNYARLLFMWNNKLLIDKPNLAHLGLSRFLLCSQEFMARWTSWSMLAVRGARAGQGADDQDMDRKFLQDLRELKPEVGAADVTQELSQHCIRALLQRKLDTLSPPPPTSPGNEAQSPPSTGDVHTELARASREQTSIRIQSIFAKVVPSLFQIGAGLSHSRELRDIFEDVMDNVVIPCQGAQCTPEDVKLLFSALVVGFSQLTTLSAATREQYAPVVQRFLAGLSAVTAILYTP